MLEKFSKENVFLVNETKTLEEIASLLHAPLVIRMMAGRKDLWQVKLEKVHIKQNSQLNKKWASVKRKNPNYAIQELCNKLSYKTVVGPRVGCKGSRTIVLGSIVKGALYVRTAQ